MLRVKGRDGGSFCWEDLFVSCLNSRNFVFFKNQRKGGSQGSGYIRLIPSILWYLTYDKISWITQKPCRIVGEYQVMIQTLDPVKNYIIRVKRVQSSKTTVTYTIMKTNSTYALILFSKSIKRYFDQGTSLHYNSNLWSYNLFRRSLSV